MRCTAEVCLLGFLLQSSCASVRPRTVSTDPLEALVDTAIRWVQQKKLPLGDEVVFDTASAPSDLLGSLNLQSLKLPRALLEAHTGANMQPHVFKSSSLPSGVVALAAGATAKLMARDHPWTRFYADFPRSRGFMSISVPGFDAQQQEAVLYVDHAFGEVGLEADLVRLKKRGATWVVVDVIHLIVG